MSFTVPRADFWVTTPTVVVKLPMYLSPVPAAVEPEAMFVFGRWFVFTISTPATRRTLPSAYTPAPPQSLFRILVFCARA
ncbi:hypothetical protein RSEGYP2_44 [Ralstonia phage RsoP1EGY]|uniref:Uncharacterized protein n=1 Tax=Ralstonia phage RsoP1EGY TaxID=2070026 RepID=A0A2R2ZGG2_9CAUD|nr:hypothetical protein HOT00_gp44 [Ralstonia phage RsoP1EGY]AUO78202.1 hypothetical protein RSEGYP2_44 [Ralstonia phage RsoP1EGY]